MAFVRHARVWKRILAFLFDLVLCCIIFIPLIMLMISEAPSTASTLSSARFSPVAAVTALYLGIFMLLYHVFTEWMIGQTVGMMLFGVRVQSKKPLLFWQALVRNLFVIPLFPFNLLWVVEPMYYVFQGERLLEHWTQTQTVE